jgi:hypothetical protein
LSGGEGIRTTNSKLGGHWFCYFYFYESTTAKEARERLKVAEENS